MPSDDPMAVTIFPRSQERGLIEATELLIVSAANILLSAFARTRPH